MSNVYFPKISANGVCQRTTKTMESLQDAVALIYNSIISNLAAGADETTRTEIEMVVALSCVFVCCIAAIIGLYMWFQADIDKIVAK